MSSKLNIAKTVYLPYMSDHCFAVAAALEANGIAASVLPKPDDRTLSLGMDKCRGRECLPAFITTGDILRLTSRPGFNADQSQILMASSCGPCRFGQYASLQQTILAELGLPTVEFISPGYENNYDGFGDNPLQIRQLVWKGFVAVDLLLKLLHTFRPYELEVGAADHCYELCLAETTRALRLDDNKLLVKTMTNAAERFKQLPVDRRHRRPRIGLVGELYLRLNSFSNQDIVRKVEAAGGEVYMAPLIEWLYFINWGVKTMTRTFREYLPFFVSKLTDGYQRHWERKLSRPVAELLEFPMETPIEKLLAPLKPYYEIHLGTEAVLSMAKSIELAKCGYAGILNVMPFTCMPGLIAAGMAPSFRPDIGNIPWLDISYEAQRGTNLTTRLEAFMYQAKEAHYAQTCLQSHS